MHVTYIFLSFVSPPLEKKNGGQEELKFDEAEYRESLEGLRLQDLKLLEKKLVEEGALLDYGQEKEREILLNKLAVSERDEWICSSLKFPTVQPPQSEREKRKTIENGLVYLMCN